MTVATARFGAVLAQLPSGPILVVVALSPTGMQVMATIQTSASRPTVLNDAFRGGHLSVEDLRDLVPFVWLYDD